MVDPDDLEETIYELGHEVLYLCQSFPLGIILKLIEQSAMRQGFYKYGGLRGAALEMGMGVKQFENRRKKLKLRLYVPPPRKPKPPAAGAMLGEVMTRDYLVNSIYKKWQEEND